MNKNKIDRTYTVLPPKNLFQKSLRFASLMERSDRTIQSLLVSEGPYDCVPVSVSGFSFPIIIREDMLVDNTSPLVDKIIDSIANLVLVQNGTLLRIEGANIREISLSKYKKWVRFIELSSFADVIYAHLSKDPLFNSEQIIPLIKSTVERIQIKFETAAVATPSETPVNGETKQRERDSAVLQDRPGLV